MVWAGAIVMAQKVSTPEELDKAMKAVLQNNMAANKAIQSGAFADAKAAVANLKQALMSAETFWVLKKKDDAVGFSKAAIGKVEAVEKALAAAAPDAAAVTAAFREVGPTCMGCHREYRDRDASGNYVIRPGKVD
jgi:multidrug resistance efflux pump